MKCLFGKTYLILLLALSACSLARLTPVEKEQALAGVKTQHAELISALEHYKVTYGFYPARKESLIEEHLLRVSSLPEATKYRNAGPAAAPNTCAAEYRAALSTDRNRFERALHCANERAGKRKVSLQLARELCPEFFPPEYEQSRKKTSLEVNSNCCMGFKAYELTAEILLGKKTALATYASESASWSIQDSRAK